MVSGMRRVVNDVSAPPRTSIMPNKTFQLGSFAVDECRPMRVVVVGAGYSGIVAGVRIPQRLSNIELVIYEKLGGVGGVWSVSFHVLYILLTSNNVGDPPLGLQTSIRRVSKLQRVSQGINLNILSGSSL